MSASPDAIFQEVVSDNIHICRRCFQTSQSTSQRDSLGGVASCGEDCGTLSATLEDESISRSEIELRAPRLKRLILEHDYEIDEEVFMTAIDILAGVNEPPGSIFLDSIRVATGQLTIEELLDEHGIESEYEERIQSMLRDLPSSEYSGQDFREFDENVQSAVATVTDSGRPGSDIYYIADPDAIPEDFQPVSEGSPSAVMRKVIQQNESWFFRTSPEVIEDWLSEIDAEFRNCAASCLLSHIRSRNRHTRSDTPVEEQFRSSALWPVLKDEAERIMGNLRKHEEPQPLEEIAECIDLSISTTHTVLTVLRNAEPVGDQSNQQWEAVPLDSE